MGTEYEFHPLAELFPLMGEAELRELAQDIGGPAGLRSAITLYERKILDGRNRYLACRIACVEPWYEEWKGPGSPLAWVVSMNLHRRHLNESQRAIVGARARALFEEEARKRQATSTGGAEPQLSANLRKAEGTEPIHAAKEAARLVNVSTRSVESASRVIASGSPALVRAVETGEIAVSRAAKIAQVGDEARKRAAAAKEAEAEARARADAAEAERQARLAAEAKAEAAAEQKRALEAERRKKSDGPRRGSGDGDFEIRQRAEVETTIHRLDALWERLSEENRGCLLRSIEGFIERHKTDGPRAAVTAAVAGHS